MRSAISTSPNTEMTDALNSSPVLARADALMQRRRQNAAGDFEDVPLLTDVVPPDDDIPVVTDVAAEPSEAADDIGPAVLRILADELAEKVRTKVAAEIPSLVEASLHSLLATMTSDLQQGISETTEQALRDFIAQREKLARQQQR